MLTIFILKKEPPKKKTNFFLFLKGRYSVIGLPIDMNVGVFWYSSAGFLKSGFATFLKI